MSLQDWWAKDRVLVTGGTGYVGTALVPLLAKSHPVRVFCSMAFGNAIEGTPNVEFVKGDIQDRGAISLALQDCDAVIHLAGIVTDELCAMNPEYARKVNVGAMADQRENKNEIALKVTTKDDVSAWSTDRFKYILKQVGLNIVDSGETVVIKGDILTFVVVEDSLYRGNIGIEWH